MPTLQALREQRAGIWEQMKHTLAQAEAEGRDLTAEERSSYDAQESDIDRIGADVDRLERHEARARALDTVDRSGLPEPRGAAPDAQPRGDYAAAFAAYLRAGEFGLDPEQRAALRHGRVDGAELRAAGVGTASAGGYAVPDTFRGIFVETQKAFGPMLDVAEVITTTTGANLSWPTNDDTSNVGALLAENTQVSEQDVTLGTASLDAYMYTSKLVRASLQLLEDAPDFDSWLARKLGERVGRILNAHFTTGTGTGQPDGIATSATVGVTGTGSLATTGGVSYANLVDLQEALDPAYGAGAGLAWMMHQSVRKAARKLLDSTNRPLWEPSLQAGAADTLLGYPVVINNDLPTIAKDSVSLLFGNFHEAYVIRLVDGITVLRLTERYADYLQQAFLAFRRADGTVQNAGAVRAFKTTGTD